MLPKDAGHRSPRDAVFARIPALGQGVGFMWHFSFGLKAFWVYGFLLRNLV